MKGGRHAKAGYRADGIRKHGATWCGMQKRGTERGGVRKRGSGRGGVRKREAERGAAPPTRTRKRGSIRKDGTKRAPCGIGASLRQTAERERCVANPNADQHPSRLGPSTARKAMGTGIRCKRYQIPLK